ncbi:MAG TPA: hypothetical protein VH475_01030 [Tepidisphaeraceae bacterium]|jgi:hypothetical protein
MSTTATRHLRSLSGLCTDLAVTYPRLMRLLDAHGIAPTETRDGTAWFDDRACDRIATLVKPGTTAVNRVRGRAR